MTKKTVIKKIPSPLPVYAVGGVWLLCGLLFPLYKLGFLLMTCLLSLGAYLLGNRLCPGKLVESQVEEPLILTGDQLADQVIRDGSGYLSRLQTLNEAIADPEVSASIDKLQRVSQAIFAEIRKSPGKAPQIRRFINYFLPTTIKLLETYANLDASGAGGDNIRQTKADIVHSLANVEAAFDKQLDNLFSGEALDVSAEAAALRAVLAGDGLLQADMPAAPPSQTQEEQEPKIKLQL